MKLFHGFALWRKMKNHSRLMEALRVRIIFSSILGIVIFGSISCKLISIMVINKIPTTILKQEEEISSLKEDITDRNGEILATCLVTASCYADPAVVIDINETANKLSTIVGMPCASMVKQKISNKNKHFVWIARHIPPAIQQKIMDLGLPGIFFKKDYKRIYPHGNLFSHTIGGTDIDGNGVYGIEKQFNDILKSQKIALTLDVRIQGILHEELKKAINKFDAIGGNAIVMKTNGEIIAMVSLPDFNPNCIRNDNIDSMFNRNTIGTYEPGSTFKILNTAIALENGIQLGTKFDATAPVKIGRFSITDFKGKNRHLSLAEAFVFSSNIAAIKISQEFGLKTQQQYMKKFGVFDKCSLEIPEIGGPIVPKVWTEPTSMTVSYGYGVSITPLQLLSLVTSITNGGYRTSPTLLLGRKNEKEKILSKETSNTIVDLMRATVCFGTAKKAGIEGTEIFGKTGTAYKKNGTKGYGTNGNRLRITTFIGGFSRKNPKYMLLVMLDNPQPIEGTFGYATAGWNAAPTANKIFERIVPILGSEDDFETNNSNNVELIVTKYLKLN